MKHGIRHHGPSHESNERGSAIVAALVLVTIVSTLSMIFIQQSLAKNKEQRMSVDSKRAFYMAEAGLSEAFNGLCIGKSGNVGSPDEPARFANGVFWATATEEGQGRVTLEATGLCGAGRATLSIVVERAPDTVGALGFFGNSSVTVKPGATIDSYNSHAGAYVPVVSGVLGAVLPAGARIGCNGDITVSGTLRNPTKVYGEVRPGPTGTVFSSLYSTITGTTAPSLAATPLPAIQPPTITATGTLEATNTGAATVSTPGVVGYASITTRPDAELRIVGPAIIVTRALTLTAGSVLSIDATNGPVRMFVLNACEITAGAKLRTITSDPLNVSLQIGATGMLNFDATAAFHGTIYAPNAQLTLGSGFEVYGSVAANSLTVESGGKLHFDEALAAGDAHEDGTPRILGWRIVQLPKVDIVNLRYDALKKLREEGVTVLDSKAAHVDIGVTPP